MSQAQECNSDALYWNATLRTDPYLSDKQRIRDDTQFVYSRGLVALSLFGNKITGEEMASFNEIISKNYWLLGKYCDSNLASEKFIDNCVIVLCSTSGLNLAENKLTEENLDNFVESVKKNDVIQAVLLRNNPGLTADNCLDLYKSVFAKMQLSDDLGSNGFARINLLGPTVSWMVKSWMRLQCEETRDLISVSSPSSRPDGSSNFDKSLASVSTYGNVGGGMVSRSPRRQQEVERKILFEEAKEYSVVAYTEPKGAQVFRFDNTSISNSNGRATLNSRLDSKAVPNDFEPVPELAEPENDQTWDTYVPVPSPPTEQQRNKSSNRKIASTIAQESTGDGEFLGFWPDEYVPRNADLRRPPSRISIRPRTALAISTDDEGDKPNISTQLSASGRRSVSAKSQLMSGRHSQSMQDAYNIKDVDLISNQRYIPHYLLANNKDIPVVENGVDRRLRSSSSDAGHLRGSVSRSQQLSRTKSPPWRPPSSHHHPSDHKPVPQVPLTKNDAVFPRESISTDRSRLYRQDVRNTEVLHFRPPRSNRPVEDRERTLLKKKATKKASTKTSKKDKLSKKGKVPSSEVESYRKMSESVVKATKRLEKASEKLLTVVESLSESAMLNINQSHLSTVSGSKVQARRHLQEESAKSSRGHTADINTSHLSNGSSIEDVALEELVRARLNFNLRKTLNDALLHGAN